MTGTREEWLLSAAAQLSSLFDAAGFSLRNRYRITCGFPSKGATSRRSKRLGEAWPTSASADGTAEVMISPALADPIGTDAMGVLPVLVHELVHVATPGSGHKGAFKRCAKAIGLEGKMTSTHAGAALCERLRAIVDDLGPYPHAALSAEGKVKPGSRLLLVSCGCGFKVRAARKTAEAIEAAGWECPACGSAVRLNEGDEPGEEDGE